MTRVTLGPDWRPLRNNPGSHLYLLHPAKPHRVRVPMHKGKTLKLATLAGILDDAGLTVDEFRRLL